MTKEEAEKVFYSIERQLNERDLKFIMINNMIYPLQRIACVFLEKRTYPDDHYAIGVQTYPI